MKLRSQKIQHFLRFHIFLLSFIAGSGCGSLYAQDHHYIDSLQDEIKHFDAHKKVSGGNVASLMDSVKAKWLEDIGWEYISIGNDSGLIYAHQALTLSEKIGYKKGIALADLDIGSFTANIKKDYAQALQYFRKTLTIWEEINDKEAIPSIYRNMGIAYGAAGNYSAAITNHLKQYSTANESGNYNMMAKAYNSLGGIYRDNIVDFNKAMDFFKKASEISKKANDKNELGYALEGIAQTFFSQSDYPRALENYFSALKIFEEIGDKSGIAIVCNNTGLVFFDDHDYPQALEYYLKALKINEEIGDKPNIAVENENIGDIYMHNKEYPKALEYYSKELSYAEENDNKHLIANANGSIGRLYNEQGQYEKALDYFLKDLKIGEELRDKSKTAWELRDVGAVYLSLVTSKKGMRGNRKPEYLHQSFEYLQRGLALGIELNERGLIESCNEKLAQAYEISGNYKDAFECYKKSVLIHDSIFSVENDKKIVQMEMRDEYRHQRFADSVITENKEKSAHLQLQRQKSYTYLGIAGILLLAGFSFFIVKERRKSEKLLLNILPAEVAAELKEKGITKARHFDNVTVLFTDFVNFTQTSERLTPQALIDELHTCFKAFDEITAKYNIEKIKTIGDAYLAVCGLPLADPNHAENVVRAAIEINAFMQNRLAKLGNRTFEIRIGIHSGSVVAGIVGVKKFAYDIWGDTVNIAARMEQNGEAGKINISQASYEIVKDKFTFEYRGEIDAKGKGLLKMYYLN